VSDGYHVEDEAQAKSYDSVLMRRLMRYIRPYRLVFIVATIFLFVSAVLSNAVPLYIMRAVDGPIQGDDRVQYEEQVAALGPGESLPPEAAVAYETQKQEDFSTLQGYALLIAALMIGETLLRFAQLAIVAYVGQKTMLQMRLDVFEHLQRMSLRFLDSHPIGRLMTRVTNDVEKIQQSIVTGMVQVISDFLTIGVVLAYMLYVNWALALVTLSTVPFIFLTSLVFRNYARKSFLEIRRRIASVNAYMQENVTGMRVVQLFNREDKNFEAFRRRNAEHRDEWLRQVMQFAIYFPTVEFFSSLAIALIILYGGFQIIGDAEIAATASVGMFFAYVQWAQRLFNPVKAIADRYNLLLEAMASSERIFHLLDEPEELTDKPEAVEAGAVKGAVDYENVSFAYVPGQYVLRDINLSIEPGERIAIVGHTGAGKTTLTSLLSRFYEVTEGRIRVDGIDVRDYRKESLRSQIGVVLQDVFLFSGTIEQNIRLGDKAMSMDWVRECAAHVNAARFIERLPDGYDYQVGERGMNLSTGQRQLLAFARTLAHQPRILVLDEATSSVDTETEQLIQDAIEYLMEGRTSIVIAHRLSTVQNADRIVVMHHGAIREIGSHRELLAHGGIYQKLYELQYKDAV